MTAGRRRRSAAWALPLVVAVALAACAPAVTGGPSAGPTVAGDRFAGWERSLIARGRLRTDRAPADAPFTNAMLVRNFGRISFGLEADANLGRRARTLHRRDGPLRWRVVANGPDAGAARADVARTFDRIARATSLDIAQSTGAGSANLHILFLGPGDYASAAAWARSALGRPEAALIEKFRTDSVLCTGSVTVRDGTHGRAMVLIREGYSDVVRLGCVEEELAQILGLANDHASVRPSVFNDDEEFALLTTHDELLLRILYDARLRPGMTAAEAMPLVAHIVEDLRPGR